jgi:hypothetical protein
MQQESVLASFGVDRRNLDPEFVYARPEIWCRFMRKAVNGCADAREINGSDCAPGGRADSKIEISSPAPSRF